MGNTDQWNKVKNYFKHKENSTIDDYIDNNIDSFIAPDAAHSAPQDEIKKIEETEMKATEILRTLDQMKKTYDNYIKRNDIIKYSVEGRVNNPPVRTNFINTPTEEFKKAIELYTYIKEFKELYGLENKEETRDIEKQNSELKFIIDNTTDYLVNHNIQEKENSKDINTKEVREELADRIKAEKDEKELSSIIENIQKNEHNPKNIINKFKKAAEKHTGGNWFINKFRKTTTSKDTRGL